MKNIDKELNEWVIDKIKREYNGKISLLLGRKGACKTPKDEKNVIFDFFVPACDEGYSLAETFIIEDMGYDLFPISWERLEGIAALNEGISFCLADSEILYSRNDADKERFEILRKTFFNNLKNKDLIYAKSLERINNAMDLYKNMMFENSLCNIRKASGGILQSLCEALVTINGTYIKGDYGYAERINQIKLLEHIPDKFIEYYEKVIKINNSKEIYDVVHKLISETRDFFKALSKNKKSNNFYFEDLAGWYEESRYTFRRIEYACKSKNYEASFTWGCYLQVEFDILSEEAGLKKMDLLGAYNAEDLSIFEKRAHDIENYIISEIDKHGGVLRKYDNLEEFLKCEK